MNLFTGRPIIIGVPVGLDYKVDARLVTIVELWDRDPDKCSYYAASTEPRVGRDKIVQFASHRIPLPSHILFVDSDILPRHKTLEKLLALDKDIVAGMCHMIQGDRLSWNVFRTDLHSPLALDEAPDNPFKLVACGFGIVLVKTEVFQRMEWPYWENEYGLGHITKGEDITFCLKAREAGYDIWCEPKVKCAHVRTANLMNLSRAISKEKQKCQR